MEGVMLTQTESDKESCEGCVVFMFSVLGWYFLTKATNMCTFCLGEN